MNKLYQISIRGAQFQNLGEAFSVLMAKFATKFQCGTNHSSGLLRENGLYTYYMATNYNRYFGQHHCEICRDKTCKNIQLENLKLGSRYVTEGKIYQWRNAEIPTKGKITDAEGKFLGAYCPRKNILFTTDWSHWADCATNIADAFLPYLAGELVEPVPKLECTLGTDPEFEQLSAMDNYRVIWPSGIPGGTDPEDEIGIDGAGAQIELRPKASSDPKIVINNLKALIEECGKPMSVRGDVHPLGGHIHIGFPEVIRSVCKNSENTFCQLYDAFLGISMLSLSGKARESYKRLTACELKNWGFEYRSLPAAWMINPKIATITFVLMKKLTEELINDGDTTIDLDENGCATEKEYLKRLTPSQYKYWKFFLANYETMIKVPAINTVWTMPNAGIHPVFHDGWDAQIKNALMARLTALKVKGSYRTVFYGLRSNRGNTTAGWTTEAAVNITNNDSTTSYGIPYTFRTTEFPEVSIVDLLAKVMTDVQLFETLEQEEPVCA